MLKNGIYFVVITMNTFIAYGMDLALLPKNATITLCSHLPKDRDLFAISCVNKGCNNVIRNIQSNYVLYNDLALVDALDRFDCRDKDFIGEIVEKQLIGKYSFAECIKIANQRKQQEDLVGKVERFFYAFFSVLLTHDNVSPDCFRDLSVINEYLVDKPERLFAVLGAMPVLKFKENIKKVSQDQIDFRSSIFCKINGAMSDNCDNETV